MEQGGGKSHQSSCVSTSMSVAISMASKDATATPLAPSISTLQPAASHSQTASRPVGQHRQQHLRKAVGTAY